MTLLRSLIALLKFASMMSLERMTHGTLARFWPAVLFGPCARAHQREDPNCIDEFDAWKSIGEYRRWNQTEFESRLDNKSLFWHQNVETLSNRKRTEGNHDEYRNKPLVEVVLPRSLPGFFPKCWRFQQEKIRTDHETWDVSLPALGLIHSSWTRLATCRLLFLH